MSMTWHGEPPDAGGPEPLAPGATIGILGGGQLGRMSAMAAARLGYRCHVFAPDADSPGMQIAAATTVAAYEDGEALRRFSAAVDVVTFEFENVPAETLEALEPLAPCRPGVEVLRVCQDRLAEKEFLGRAGVPVAPWRAVRSLEELREAIAAIGLPAVLKTTRMGYDGRGQEVLRRPEEADRGLSTGWSRSRSSWKPSCRSTLRSRPSSPAPPTARSPCTTRWRTATASTSSTSRSPRRACRSPWPLAARGHAARVATELGLVGVLALEMFLLPDGALFGNEIAPRPHNSGHWTIDACLASQFEQHIRAVAGLPLADPARHHDAVMRNLIGPAGLEAWPDLVRDGRVAAHLYGKAEARPGRKLGHATRLLPLGAVATLGDPDLAAEL